MNLPDSENIKISPSQCFKQQDLSIELNCRGNFEYTKLSYPVKYGLFSRLETCDYIFEFNLNHEICHARSKQKEWIHPSEWLKRTMGNDWVYYSSGGYSGVFEALGEYYLPNLMYPTNSLLGGKPFNEPQIDTIVNNWQTILAQIPAHDLPDPFAQWLKTVQQKTPNDLEQKAQELFNICGSRVTVMPPDARHVDYNIIPLTISDGCLYKCRFCKIKNKKPFSIRSQKNISDQISQLKALYAKDLVNYNALFLGEHDALNAPDQLIIDTVKQAMHEFEFHHSVMKGRSVFIFASADSLLNTGHSFFEQINNLDVQTYINVGLESYDQATLDLLGKPITSKKVAQAFKTIQQINTRFSNVEITCNFVMDDSLPDSHYKALMTLARESVTHPQSKGSIYLSPLKFASPSRQVLYDFYKLKSLSRFPTFLYIIQRL
ncbi:MAG: radical SAM protein [Pseudomonadota bacterium]